MEIQPGYRLVRLRLRTASGVKLRDLDLQGVRTVAVERMDDRELLRVDFPEDSPASTLWLRMTPDLTIICGLTTPPPDPERAGSCMRARQGMSGRRYHHPARDAAVRYGQTALLRPRFEPSGLPSGNPGWLACV
ncbi:hypothetical protein ACPPVO_24195 [Dactylosporangium sp. McL0621]|uniref:hypothetical protein n=1 Tax=Dactylosporangium sp. McL0621 TaxID=3415678 RepID=UPI003CF5B543